MASPAALYFAGIGTVVGALALGFSGAIVLTNTQPANKAPPAAFSKRDQPIEVEDPAAQTTPATTAETTGQALARTASFDIVPAPATKAEEVVALQFAPPQPQPATEAPAARTIAPDPVPDRTTIAATPREINAREVKTPVEPAVKPAASDKPATSDAVKPERKLKKENRKAQTAVAEKKEPLRKQYVEHRKKKIELVDDDDKPARMTSFGPEHQYRSGEGFFSFHFGN